MATRWLAPLAIGLAILGAAACGGGGGQDAEDFAEFAPKIASAAEQGDTAFFAERVQGETRTCTEAEVAASTGPDAPDQPLCRQAGDQFEAVVISNYGGQGMVTNVESLIADIEAFFEGALSEEEDRYGPGSVRLYAAAVPARSGEPESGTHTAILTAMIDFNGRPSRFVRGVDFEYADGRWVIRGETTAGFPIAVELLEPSSASLLYQEWTKYED